MNDQTAAGTPDLGLDTTELATALTVAWLSNSNNRISVDEVPTFLNTMHQTLTGLSGGVTGTNSTAEDATEYTPAVSVRKSLASKDHIISLIDGKPYKTLRRHLKGHGLTPEQYRERYNLKADYPMVAETYSTARRDMAKKIGLGRKPKAAEAAAEPAAKPAKAAGRGRRKADA
jgi:predicted transcriptional regulator